MKTFASMTFLLANLGLFVWAQTDLAPLETHFNSAEGRESEVMRVFNDFEDAKLHKNATKFSHVLVRVKQLKDTSKDIAAKIQHRIDVNTDDIFWGKIDQELDRIRLYKQDQALNVVAYEILAHQANIADFVARSYSEGVDAVLLLENNKLEKSNKDGQEIQKSIEAAYTSPNKGSSVDAALIEKIYYKLDNMIVDAAEYRRDVLSVYQTEMFKHTLQANKDLSLTQKYYVSLITAWTTYTIDYVKSYQVVFKHMFNVTN